MFTPSSEVKFPGLMSDAVVHLFPQGRHGNDGYRGIDDSPIATQMNECDVSQRTSIDV